MNNATLELIYKYTDNGIIEGRILDVGGAGLDYQKEQGYNFEEYFESKGNKYYLLDNRDVKGANFICDAAKYSEPNGYDSILCTGMLEHSYSPFEVMQRIYENLKIGGSVIVTVPYIYHIHCEQDYYRFTKNGLKLLCNKFNEIDSGEIGFEKTNNLEYFFVGIKDVKEAKNA